jgi:cell surface protein SprA
VTKLIKIILLSGLILGKGLPDEIFLNPFKEKLRPNYALSDISNYPIGIFKINQRNISYELELFSNKNILIRKKYYNHNIGMPYVSNMEDYIKELYSKNQKFNFAQPFIYTSSDTSISKKKFVQLAEIDLGALGLASLQVQGNINLSGKLVNQDQELVRSSYKEQEKTNFKFDQKQQLKVQGKIGDKITVSLDQNSERDFDWENTIKVEYQGDEDDILQKLEIGNISLSLPSTEFVTFSGQNKGLFGIKSLSKLGPIDITSIASVEKTEKQSQKYKGTSEQRVNPIKDYSYRKDLYFFIHEWFRNGSNGIVTDSGFSVNIPSYYPLVNGLHAFGNIVVKNFELYKIDISNNPQADPGIAYIDPNDLEFFSDQSKQGSFIKLDRGSDYIVNEDLGFIRMQSPLQSEIIAAHYQLVDRDSGEIILNVGSEINTQNSSLVLKMIKAQSSHPNHPTWDLMFKNVYYIGSTNIQSESLEVEIIDNFSTPESDRTNNGETFLKLFGLDNFNQTGNEISDEIIDYNNSNIVNLQAGEIHFPSLLPFVSENKIDGGNDNQVLMQILQDGKMYTSTNISEYSGDSRFTINTIYNNPTSSISLGFTLVEGSEEITYNGNKLQRGQDYQIDYFSGMIIFMSEISPDGDLEIAYDKHDLVSFDRKIMAGTRAQIDINENSFIGLTALYYDQNIINNKVEVGYEPIRNFIWDINGRYEKDLDSFSSKFNQLKFINSRKMSNFSIEGEIAQVLPNPNSISNSRTGDKNGVAFIDDFEGSKRVTSPSIMKRFWHFSSAPKQSMNTDEFSQANRMKLFWYNPYSQVLTNSIWPNVSTSQRAQNLTTDILVLEYQPKEYQYSINPDSLWAGLTAPMFVSDYDQTRSRFLEIWIKGDKGKLTIDLGEISEDFNGNGILDTEDVPEAGLALGNGFLENEEDTGLDGCFNDYEDGFGNCLDSSGLTYNQLLENGQIELINTLSDIDPNDPNDDDWSYAEGSNNYENVNGTESNGTGDSIQAGGKYPDTEDLDKSGFLDTTNNFFTKTISLENNKYISGSTEINGIETGWKLIRIPISNFERIQNPSLSEVKYVRLTVSGVNEPTKLEVAKIEIVGNTWQELGTSIVNQEDYALQDSTFVVSVVNDEDNPDYNPPKGVFGEYDRINDIRSKEQSLVLKFDNLKSNFKGAAKKVLSQSEDKSQSFLMYDRMKMFIYGNSDFATSETTELKFFIQFGNGDEYYKLTKPIYDNWDEELNRNELNIDLNWLTSLKNMSTDSILLLNDNDVFIDSLNYKKYILMDNNNLQNESFEIFGNPSLSRLKYFIVGIENTSNQNISGEIWLDELRLSGVKKESGTAIRLKSNFNLSDLSESSISYSKVDADFHVLQERLGKNQTVESFNFNNNMQLGKFFPKNLGIAFPLNINYNSLRNTPKFFPGSDIRTNEIIPDSILVRASTVSFNGKISKNIKSEKPIIKYSIDNLSAGFNISKQKKSDVIMKSVDTSKINTNIDYNLNFPSDNYSLIFKWAAGIPIVGNNISDTKFYYTPSSFSSSIRVNSNLKEKVSRNNNLIEDYTLGLQRRFSFNYKIFDNTQLAYNKNIISDMSDYREKVLSSLKSGIITNSNESTNFNTSPSFGWFKPSISISTNYVWNKPLSSAINAANINLVKNNTFNISISPTEIIESFYTPNSNKENQFTQSRSRSSSLARAENDNELSNSGDEKNEDEKKLSKNNVLMEKIYYESKKIEPLSITFSNNLNRSINGVKSDVPTSYRLGLDTNLLIPSIDEVGLNTGNKNITKSFSSRTGIRFNPQSSITFSFNESISSNINGYGIDIRSSTRDFISFGDYLSKGFPFTSWSLRIGGLEDLKFINKRVASMSIQHAVSGKQNLAWKFNDGIIPSFNLLKISSFENQYNDNLQLSRITRSFSPLIGVSTSFKNGVSTNVRGNYSHTLTEVQNGITYVSDSSILATITYNFTRGIRFSVPFSERSISLRNNINISLNLDFSNKIEEGSKDKINFVEQNFSNTKKGILRLTYTLTNDITGSLFYEYRQNDTRLTGKRIDRDFGLNLNVAIRGK